MTAKSKLARARERKAKGHPGGGPIMIQQEDAEAADIQRLVRTYLRTGQVDGAAGEGNYGDFTNADDYHTAMSRVRDAEEQFMRLPAHIRRHVDNDPGQLLDLVQDPERKNEMVELGLLTQEEADLVLPKRGDESDTMEPQGGSEKQTDTASDGD